MTFFADAIGRGLAAARPAVGDVPIGSLYYSTDSGALERNNGSTWESVAPLSAPPSGAAGGVLSGTYPNPGFAADMATQAELDAHIADSSAAHAASAVSFAPVGAIAATDAQTAIAEVATDAATALAALRLDQVAAPTADVSLNSHKLTNVTDPTTAQDAATKAYVDALAQGLQFKAPVRAATTVALTLASGVEDGDTIDGVTLATGDRVLVKNQSSGAENGIYTVNASGAPTRATDMDASGEVKGGLYVFVQEGAANADTAWVLTNDGAITLGTTALVFAQLATPGGYSEGAGIDITALVVSVDIPGLTADATPDGAADYVMTYDDSATALKKVLLNNLPGGGGGGGATVGSGAEASRPAAGNAGDLYLPTNGAHLHRDNGTIWQSWGPLFPMTPPDLGDFTWVNQDDATAVTTRGFLEFAMPAEGAVSNSLRMLVMTAPATPYTVTIALHTHLRSAQYIAGGFCWRESSSGKIQAAVYRPYNNDLGLSNWNSPTSINGEQSAITVTNRHPLYLRIADDGTNRTVWAGDNPYTLIQMLTVARTTFVTPDQIGLVLNNASVTIGAAISVYSWEIA